MTADIIDIIRIIAMVGIIGIIDIIRIIGMIGINCLICLCLRFESHMPENVINQMNDVLVQHINLILLCSSAFNTAAETKKALGQAHAYGIQKRYYAHVDFGIEQVIKGLFACGVPYRHLKVLDQERTNHLIQDQEQEKSATERNEK